MERAAAIGSVKAILSKVMARYSLNVTVMESLLAYTCGHAVKQMQRGGTRSW